MCGKGVHPLAAGCRNAYVTYWPVRIAAGCGVLLALLLTLQPQIWWWALLPVILAVPFAISGWLAWRSAGWYAGNGEWLLVQRGAFTLTSTAARIDHIQYVRWSQGLFSRANATVALAISVATSGGAGLLSRILAILRGPVDPSLVRIRAVAATDAEKIAISSGLERSLPPGLVSG
jgi:hypothetical protein